MSDNTTGSVGPGVGGGIGGSGTPNPAKRPDLDHTNVGPANPETEHETPVDEEAPENQREQDSSEAEKHK